MKRVFEFFEDDRSSLIIGAACFMNIFNSITLGLGIMALINIIISIYLIRDGWIKLGAKK